MIRKLLLALVIMMGFWQCKTQSSTQKNTTNNNQNTLQVPISRGTVRVIARLEKIKPAQKESNNSPNEAIIKIEKVVGKGAFFEGEVQQGKSLEVYFVKPFMLDKTGDAKGLKLQDKLQADIVYNLRATKVSKYHVVTYKKL
ncbi:MAG TPA: hypothetical protein DCS93_37050 [Microscillaceae bacterium]|nr:hypothetical protein [Microscillaceae bacterium]